MIEAASAASAATTSAAAATSVGHRSTAITTAEVLQIGGAISGR